MGVQFIVDDDTPGRALTMSDLREGDSVIQAVTFRRPLLDAFAVLAVDTAPVHTDRVFAHHQGFDRPILQGLCLTSRFSRLIGMYLPGELTLIETLDFKFRKPVFEDATVEFEVQIERLLRPLKVVRLRLQASADRMLCIEGTAQCLIR